MPLTKTDGVMLAVPSGLTFELTSGSDTDTGPSSVRRTSFQMPQLRPRTVVIQSQPMLAWKVGLSAPSTPPL